MLPHQRLLAAEQCKGPSGSLVQVKDIIFRRTDGSYDLDIHTAPQRQYIVMLNGAVDVTTTDHETRRFADGDILLVEDTTGEQLDAPFAHIMRVSSRSSGKTWCSLRQLLCHAPTCAACTTASGHIVHGAEVQRPCGAGKGHKSKAVAGGVRTSLFVTLE